MYSFRCETWKEYTVLCNVNKLYVAVSLAAHLCSIHNACFVGLAPFVSFLILSMSCDVSERRESKHCQRDPINTGGKQLMGKLSSLVWEYLYMHVYT